MPLEIKQLHTDTGELLENLPLILDSNSLANLLDLTNKELFGLLIASTRTNAGTSGSLYSKWTIPKRHGGVRTLYAPRGALKGVQTKIRDRIIDLAPKSDTSVAYRKGKCPGDTAKELANSAVIIKLDIKNFFPSIHQKYVKAYFRSIGYNAEVSNLLGGLLCVRDETLRFVPQGGTASPMLANRIAEMLIDPAVRKELPAGWNYKRYCDNLYIYPTKEVDPKEYKHREILAGIRGGVYASGFGSHQGSVVPYYRSQNLLGLTVNIKANMPRRKYKLLRACLYNSYRNGLASQMGEAIKLGFQKTGDSKLDLSKFKLFLSGLLNYYRDYLTESRYQKLLFWYEGSQ